MQHLVALALTVVPLVAAQGAVTNIVGDIGGKTTSLSFKGQGQPVEAMVFPSKEAKFDGMGATIGGEEVKRNFTTILAQYDSTLPQVSDGGAITGTWRADNEAGGGPLRAILDSTCTGHFSNGTELPVVTQIPGEHATNAGVKAVGQGSNEYKFAFIVSRNVRCEGNDDGIAPNCMIKIQNENGYGSIIAIQQRLTGTNGELPPAVQPSYDYTGPEPYNPNPNAHIVKAPSKASKHFRV